MSLKFGFSTGGVHKCPGIERHWPDHRHTLGRRGVWNNTMILLILERRFDNPGSVGVGVIGHSTKTLGPSKGFEISAAPQSAKDRELLDDILRESA
jgi:hypothetical protein